jgi:hypothetical protein
MRVAVSTEPRGRLVAALLLAGLTIAALAPFLGKAFHMDDPLFIWTAKHLRFAPLDFYGFDVNWEGTLARMSSVTQNPPLAAYYMALVGSVGGWSEFALHAGFLLPAVAVIIGTGRLARLFGVDPVRAGACVIAAPIFVVSSTSLMCDTMMLAFWIWAIASWIQGIRTGRRALLLWAAVLVSAASLTKYFGISLLPLMAVHAWLEARAPRVWLPFLAVPVAVLAGYQWWTSQLYGQGLLLNAVAYATQLQVGGEWPSKALATCAFTGGGAAVLLFAAPWLWDRRHLAMGAGAAVLVGALAVLMKKVGLFAVAHESGVRWAFVAQLGLWVAAGASVVVMSAAEWWRRRDSLSLLLLLWILGTMAFAGLVNWSVTGRNVLPMLPAVAILIARRLEARQSGGRLSRSTWMPVALSVGLAMLVARADAQLAESARAAAAQIAAKAGASPGGLKFEGHWGFQFYMEQQGAVALDARNLRLSPRDVIVVPMENSYLFPLPGQIVEPWFTHEVTGSSWISTMDGTLGAGYYSDGWGPLPFVFAKVPPEKYLVYRVR